MNTRTINGTDIKCCVALLPNKNTYLAAYLFLQFQIFYRNNSWACGVLSFEWGWGTGALWNTPIGWFRDCLLTRKLMASQWQWEYLIYVDQEVAQKITIRDILVTIRTNSILEGTSEWSFSYGWQWHWGHGEEWHTIPRKHLKKYLERNIRWEQITVECFQHLWQRC